MRGQKKNFNLKLYKNVAIIVFSAVVLAIIMSVIFKFNNREEAPKIITKSTHLKKLKKKLEQSASKDTVLLANAQQRVQKLLEDYVKNIGECVGKEYKINWNYVNGEGEKAGYNIREIQFDGNHQ